MKPFLYLLTLGFVIFILSSCNRFPGELEILTDKSELAIAVEIYSAEHRKTRFVLTHVPYIDATVIDQHNPDLIIGQDINSHEIVTRLTAMTPPDNIYPALKGPTNTKDKAYLVPLAFTLPLVMARNDAIDDTTDPILIRRRDIFNAGQDFTRKDRMGRLNRLGFSPAWNPAGIIDLLFLESPQFGNLFNSDMAELDKVFNNVKDYLIDWITSTAGNLEADREFARRYHYLPDNMLLSSNRMQIIRTDFRTWNIQPGTSVKNLSVRYFADDRRIPVPSVTWIGLMTKSRYAKLFMKWLLLPETQQLLIERWEREGLRVFGLFDGLSSVPIVNRTVITDRFPDFLNMIPENHFLAVQEYLPDRWHRIRDEVITPWFTAAIHASENAGTFSHAYKKWDLSALQETE